MIFEYIKTPEYREALINDPTLLPLIDKLKEEYNELKEDCYGILSYSKYKQYFENGNRNIYEKPYFRRRALLVRAMILSLLYPEDECYSDTAQDMIWDICGEYSWVVPAHSFQHKIDLFSSETALILSECIVLLEEKLDKTVINRARKEIKSRVIDIYNSEELSWEYGTSNWTAVCTSHIGIAMMYAFPEDFDKNAKRMIKSMEAFLGGFSKEGVCYEGPTYWVYGFGCFVWFADALYRYTGGKTDLLSNERASIVAMYPKYITLCGGAAVSFSDSSPNLNFGLLLIGYLSDYYKDEYPVIDKKYLRISTNVNNSQFSYINYFLYADILNGNPQENTAKKDYFLPDAGYMIYNRENYSFAIKAGNNAELHNHNDIGSFIFADCDGQALCDLGCGFYSADYFGEKRYEILCNSSLGHSVPIINGKGQMPGREHFGSIDYKDGAAVIDFGNAYDTDGLESLTRTVTARDESVVLTDSFKGTTHSFTERFVSLRKPVLQDDTVVIGKTAIKFDSEKLSLQISTGYHQKHNGTDQLVYFIDFDIKDNQKEIAFIISAYD